MKARLLLLVVFAGSLRLGNVALDGSWRDPLRNEPTEEVVLAQRIAEGRGFVCPYQSPGVAVDHPSAHSPPAYPYLLAGLIRAARLVTADPLAPYRAALLVSVLVGSLVVGVLAVVGQRALGGAGFWGAGLLLAVWPTLLRTSGVLWDTPFALLGIALGMLVATSPWPSPGRIPSALLAGAGAALFTLFNPLVAPFLAVALLARGVAGAGLRRGLPYLLAAGAAWLVCLAPWLVRNAVAFERFIPVRNNFGLELWMGNHPEADGTTESANRRHPINDREERRLVDEVGEDAYVRSKSALASKDVRAEPGAFARKTFRRVGLYWFGDTSKPTSLFGRVVPGLFGVNVVKILLNSLLVSLAVLGTRRWGAWPRWLAWFGILTLPLPYYVTHVSPIYRAVVDPLLCLLAGLYLGALALSFLRRGTAAGPKPSGSA